MNRSLWYLTIGFPALVFIVALGSVIWILTREAPHAAPFGEVAPFEALEAPDLGLGDTALSAIVTDTDGQPIPAATVITTQSDRVRRDTTDQEGRFLLTQLMPGETELTVLVLHRLPTKVTVKVGAGEQEITISNQLVTPPEQPALTSSDLELELLLPRPADSPKNMVLVFDPVGAPQTTHRAPRRITLGEMTRITVKDLHHGTWTLRLLAKGGTVGLDWELLQPLGAPPLRLTHPGPEPLPLITHTGTIAGMLRNADGEPIAGALVLALPANGQGPSLPPAETDAEGRVLWNHVPTGNWLVRWRARGAGAETPLTVQRGGTANPFP